MGEQSPYQLHIDRVTGYDLALLHHFQGLSRHLLFFYEKGVRFFRTPFLFQ